MKSLDGAGDIVSLLREKYKGSPNNSFIDDINSSDISEIYLFFDYDFQNRNLTLEQMNLQISEMFDLFNDETDNGQLYINYPMLESIRYTKTLPDSHFSEYAISRNDCLRKSFKQLAQDFTDYHSLDFILLDFRRPPSESRISTVKHNWEMLEKQNVIKANYLCNGLHDITINKESISQKLIFEAQLSQYINPKNEVAVLSAFPLFIFNYFKR